ncbi:MAG: sugar-binding transcriptional regulator [Gemmatirosa sp.]|nr:sugar-binding transcriptional regulator [Gemmatirosa sp.]
MARPRSAPDLYLLSKVSTLYYLRDQTQQDIAERLRISRPTVSRLLQEARDQGIVQITVAPPRGLHIELETRLEDRYGLEAVQVASGEAGQDPALLRRQVGVAAAAYLARTIQPNETLGLAWGTTLNAMVQAMAPLPTPGVRVVQTLGGIGPPDAEAYAADLVRRLAQLLGAGTVLLPAPGVVATAAVRDVLRDDPHVQTALRQLDALDTVYVGIGALATNPVLNDGHSLPAGTLAELRDAGAVGDIALRFFDAEGTPVETSLDGRLLGITTDQLRRVRRVVAVASGPEKEQAIRAALRAKLVNVLIIDEPTAQALAGG